METGEWRMENGEWRRVRGFRFPCAFATRDGVSATGEPGCAGLRPAWSSPSLLRKLPKGRFRFVGATLVVAPRLLAMRQGQAQGLPLQNREIPLS